MRHKNKKSYKLKYVKKGKHKELRDDVFSTLIAYTYHNKYVLMEKRNCELEKDYNSINIQRISMKFSRRSVSYPNILS